MSRIFDRPAPRVFALPPGVHFAEALAAGVRRRLGDAPPEAIAGVEIIVNTRRTLTAVSEAFETAATATFLPRLSLLDAFADGASDAPPAIDRLARRVVLTRLIEAMLEKRPAFAPTFAADALARSLASVLDEMQRERAPLARLERALESDAAEGLAAHWRVSLDLFEAIRTLWPEQLAEYGRIDPEARRAADLDALLAGWRAAPPDHPVIAAGSTGSQRLTSDLLVEIARLPQGAVLLPGFDFHMSREAWEAIGPEHPQFGFARLLARLGLSPPDVRPWGDAAMSPRARLLSEALRPAPVTDAWRAASGDLSDGAAASGLTLIEAPSPRREAEAIALVMRRALDEPGRTAALVTPDRGLARRVAAALARWRLQPDDSAGRPLALTPPGVLMTMIAGMLVRAFDPAALLALLKHPLVAAGERRTHLVAVAKLEMRGLRRRDAARRMISVDAALAAKDAAGDALADGPVAAALAALRPWPDARSSLGGQVRAFRAAVIALTGGAAWTAPDEAAAMAALDRLEAAGDAVSDAAPPAFPAALSAALEEAGDVRAEAFRAHPRLKIWGPLEARAQRADVMILGGLNEGVWPQAPAIDPWFSRSMRKALELPSPERRVGLSSHDFQQAAAARRAIFTRALKADGAPTRPARWLARLTTLLQGTSPEDLKRMRAEGAGIVAASSGFDNAAVVRPASRPAPAPPVPSRPRKLWVTDIEALIRDPYSVYARRILGLRPLDPLSRGADARLRGEALHEAVERFIADSPEWPGPDAARVFDRSVAAALANIGAGAAATEAWRARLVRVRDWFLEEERARRGFGAPIGTEVAGEVVVATPSGPFVLAGRADRVDALRDGGLAIYDYKAGAAPTAKQVAVFAKQLPLLALIAERGGFEKIDAAPVDRLAYLRLTGSGAGGENREVPVEAGAAEGLTALIAAFEDPARAYIPRAFPEAMAFASDYDHLSRYGEWEDRAPGGGEA